jgi:hypothetical protein
MKIIIYFIVLCAMINISFAQTNLTNYDNQVFYSQGSPQANALASAVSTPVDLHTGTLNVNIPLYNLVGQNLSLPIGLSYQGRGNRVQSVAGIAGLGWNFTAGGAITRMVRGMPDEYPNGYFGINGYGQKINIDNIDIYAAEGIRTNWVDGEPDIFYFNAGGRTGMFVMDQNGMPTLLPYQNVTIKPGLGPQQIGANSWEIIFQDGSKYIFGRLEGTAITAVENSISKSGDRTLYYASAWHLMRIVSPNGDETIDFTYQTGATVKYINYHQVKYDKLSNACGGALIVGESITNINTEIQTNTINLSEISSSKGKVKFTYGNGRQDYIDGSGNFLSNIQVFNHENKFIKEYHLSYSPYSESPRLLLKEIYEYPNDGSNPQRLYTFLYNNLNLPAVDSHQIDWWGYYNNNPVDNKIPAKTYNNVNYSGADKEPDLIKAQANILTEIKNKTGGSKRFEYELNTYRSGGVNYSGAGLRIKKTIEYDDIDNSKNIITEYKYHLPDDATASSGQIDFDPRKNIIYDVMRILYTWIGHEPITGITWVDGCDAYVYKRTSSTPSKDMNSYNIGYSYVQEIKGVGNGYSWYKFSNFSDSPDEVPVSQPINKFLLGGSVQDNPYPYPPKSGYGDFTSPLFWKRGLMLENSVFDNQNRLKVKNISEYETNTNAVKNVKSLRVHTFGMYVGVYQAGGLYKTYINHFSQPVYLKKTINERYDAQGKAIRQENEYFYDAANWATVYTTPTRVKTTTSEGKVIETKYKHLFQYVLNSTNPGDPWIAGLRNLVNKNVLNAVIEESQYIDNKVTYASIKQFSPNHVNQYSKHTLEIAEPVSDFTESTTNFNFVKDGRYKKQSEAFYDGTNPYKSIQENVGTKKIIWGYDYRYVVAEATGHQDAEIFYTSFENEEGGDIDNNAKTGKYSLHTNNYTVPIPMTPNTPYIISYWYLTTANEWKLKKYRINQVSGDIFINEPYATKLDEIRVYPDSYKMVTYTHEPLIGITSKTDENDMILKYEYDGFNRLSIVRDGKNNIIKTIQYNYKK